MICFIEIIVQYNLMIIISSIYPTNQGHNHYMLQFD